MPLYVIGTAASEGGCGTLSEEVCKRLLLEAPPPITDDVPQDEIPPPHFDGGLAILCGYPEYPLYHRLSDALAYWMVTG